MKKLLIYLSLLFSISLFIFIPGVKAEEEIHVNIDYDSQFVSNQIVKAKEKLQFVYDYLVPYANSINKRYTILILPNSVRFVLYESSTNCQMRSFFYGGANNKIEGKPNDIKTSVSDLYFDSDYNSNEVIDSIVSNGFNNSTYWNAVFIGSIYGSSIPNETFNLYQYTYDSNYNNNINLNIIYDTNLDYMQIKNINGYFMPISFNNGEIFHDGDNFLTYKQVKDLEDINKSYNVTFHLNGGIFYDNNYITDDKGSYIIGNKYEDYTTMIQVNNLREYLQNQDVRKESMDFKGWYYDEKLTLKVDPDDVLTGDTNLYAKFLYADVESFLKNTIFNTYTFDTDYEYAIISLNSKTNKDIYLGLNYIDYSLEIYKYLKTNNEYKQGSVKCLTPYYSKDNKYYYWLESPLDNDYEVLILPKGKFKDDNYEFLLSNNAYVSYTNDLTKVIIKNDDGQDLETNLENSYNYSQDALLKENNIIEIFKKLAENKDNNVFSYFNQIWNYIKRSKLYTYLLTLIIGSLIILIIHVAKR